MRLRSGAGRGAAAAQAPVRVGAKPLFPFRGLGSNMAPAMPVSQPQTVSPISIADWVRFKTPPALLSKRDSADID